MGKPINCLLDFKLDFIFLHSYNLFLVSIFIPNVFYFKTILGLRILIATASAVLEDDEGDGRYYEGYHDDAWEGNNN